MTFTRTLLTLLTLSGAGLLHADDPHATTPPDPTALNATQFSVLIRFGPTSSPSVNCPNPTTYLGTPVCAAVAVFNIPAGNRFVLTNISGGMAYNPNGGGEVVEQKVNLGFNVNGTIAFSSIPFDHIQQVGNSTYLTFNQSVHMFVDPGIGFPEILISNLTGGQPFFQTGVGSAGFVFQGYLVPIN